MFNIGQKSIIHLTLIKHRSNIEQTSTNISSITYLSNLSIKHRSNIAFNVTKQHNNSNHRASIKHRQASSNIVKHRQTSSNIFKTSMQHRSRWWKFTTDRQRTSHIDQTSSCFITLTTLSDCQSNIACIHWSNITPNIRKHSSSYLHRSVWQTSTYWWSHHNTVQRYWRYHLIKQPADIKCLQTSPPKASSLKHFRTSVKSQYTSIKRCQASILEWRCLRTYRWFVFGRRSSAPRCLTILNSPSTMNIHPIHIIKTSIAIKCCQRSITRSNLHQPTV